MGKHDGNGDSTLYFMVAVALVLWVLMILASLGVIG